MRSADGISKVDVRHGKYRRNPIHSEIKLTTSCQVKCFEASIKSDRKKAENVNKWRKSSFYGLRRKENGYDFFRSFIVNRKR